MKIDKKNTLNILNSYVKVRENHAGKLLQHSHLETQDFTSFTAESLEKIRIVEDAFLEGVTSRFSKVYPSIKFVQQVAALLRDGVKILLQRVARKLFHENKEFCASTTYTINNFITHSINQES